MSVQIGKAQRIQIEGRNLHTAIRKAAVEGRIEVKPLGLSGDEQVDQSVHGGLDKAVYAYPSEHYPFWNAERASAGLGGLLGNEDAISYGAMGENLTLKGLVETDVWVGDELHFPDCVLRVTQPREPCYKFNATIGFNLASKRMMQSGYSGFYLAVVRAGTISRQDGFSVQPGLRSVSIAQVLQQKTQKHMR